MKKGDILIYHSERPEAFLNGVEYVINSIGKKKATLEAVYGQSKLTGFPTFRYPFQISVSDLEAAIQDGTYIRK